MSQQHDALWAASVAYEAAKADPTTTPEDLAALEAAWKILMAHWPHAQTVEAAEAADTDKGPQLVKVPHNEF